MENMTDIIIVVILVAVLIFALSGAKKRLKSGCCGGGGKVKKVKSADTNKAHYTYKSTVYIDGMTCEHCKARVENAFNSLPECYAVVNLKKKCAELWTNEGLSEEKVRELVENNGYTFAGYSQE